jgi:cytochrome b561
MTDTASGADYTPMQKRLHWAVVGLLILQYLVFDGVGRAFRQTVESSQAVYTTTVVAHIAIGLSIMVIAAWRLALRRRHGAPPPPEAEPELARKASKAGHALLYALLFALPAVGLAAWFLPSKTLGDLHEVGTNLLLWVAGAHVAAVLVHQFWWRTSILRRMT